MSNSNFHSTLDFSSLYPGVVSSMKPIAQKVAAKTIGANIVPVSPMSPPSGMMPYMDFSFVSPWVFDYEKIPGAIRVKIKDTFDNIINLLENPGIIVAKVLNFKIDIQFVRGSSLAGLYRGFPAIGGMSSADLNHFLKTFVEVDKHSKNVFYHGDPKGEKGDNAEYHSGLHSYVPRFERETLVEVDVIIYAPQTPFVKRHAICNHGKEYWKEDALSDYTCKKLIEDIFRKRRRHNN